MSCPICGEPTVRAWRPFCSRRCADIDLARWFRGAYAIATEAPPEEGDRSPEPDREGDGFH